MYVSIHYSQLHSGCIINILQAQVEDLVGKSILVECMVISDEDVYESRHYSIFGFGMFSKCKF